MCRRRYDYNCKLSDAIAETHVYEGDTVRINDRSAESSPVLVRRHCGGFPWWTLWLIWPAIGVLRFGADRASEVVGTIGSPFLVVQVIGAIVLIAAGVALLWSDYRRR